MNINFTQTRRSITLHRQHHTQSITIINQPINSQASTQVDADGSGNYFSDLRKRRGMKFGSFYHRKRRFCVEI